MLYLLEVTEFASDITRYDSYDGHVIRANSETEARQMAHNIMADEKLDSSNFWLNPKYSTCKPLLENYFIEESEPEIILSSFHAG